MSRLLAAIGLTVLLALPATALADEGSSTRDGKTLTVSKATELAVDGERVRVRGSGYDRNKGIYVAFCVDNGEGKVPTPCGGGADTEGSSGNSVWISDFPPAYGAGLAQPYGDGGSFDVQIRVAALLRADDPDTQQDETVDCRTVRCGVVTRNDHTRSDDRSQDVLVPVSFAAVQPPGASRGGTAARQPAATSSTAQAAPAPVAAGSPAAAATASPTTAPSAPPTTSPSPAATVAAAPEAAAPDEVAGGTSSAAVADDGGLPPVLLALPALGLLAAGSLLVRRGRTPGAA